MIPEALTAPARWLSLALALVSLGMFMYAATPAYAEHPDNDYEERVRTGQLPADPGMDPRCSEGQQGEFDGNEYSSLDFEWWNCEPDDGIPGVPGSKGWYWNPDPSDYVPLGGDVAFSRIFKPVSGVPNVYQRLLARTEWVNPSGAGTCPSVTGGCKLKTGADVHIFKPSATGPKPYSVDHTWLNNASQIYKWDTSVSPAAWKLVGATGWKMAPSGAVSKMTVTYNWGTAPAGAAWYTAVGYSRQWNGSAWVATGSTQPSRSVWDPKPGDNTPKPRKPNKLPKVKFAPKRGVQPQVEGGLQPVG